MKRSEHTHPNTRGTQLHWQACGITFVPPSIRQKKSFFCFSSLSGTSANEELCSHAFLFRHSELLMSMCLAQATGASASALIVVTMNNDEKGFYHNFQW